MHAGSSLARLQLYTQRIITTHSLRFSLRAPLMVPNLTFHFLVFLSDGPRRSSPSFISCATYLSIQFATHRLKWTEKWHRLRVYVCTTVCVRSQMDKNKPGEKYTLTHTHTLMQTKSVGSATPLYCTPVGVLRIYFPPSWRREASSFICQMYTIFPRTISFYVFPTSPSFALMVALLATEASFHRSFIHTFIHSLIHLVQQQQATTQRSFCPVRGGSA